MDTPPPPIAPPVPKWPKTLGIIAVVFGGAGLLQSLTSPLGIFLVRNQMNELTKQGADQAAIDEYIATYTGFVHTSTATLGSVAVLLLVGGILLLRKRRISSPLLQGWSILKILVGGFFLFKTAALTRLQMSIMLEPTLGAAGPGTDMQMIGQITSWAMWFGLGLGFIWLVALPVFFIAWFNRLRIKEEMAAW